MKLQNGVYIEIFSEDNSDKDKATIGGVRIEIDDCDSLHLTRKEATELIKLIRDKK